MRRWLPLVLALGMAHAQGYVVQPGDTLFRIAALFQVDVQTLQQANGLSDGVVRVGQELVIPAEEAWEPMLVEVGPLPIALEFMPVPLAPRLPAPRPGPSEPALAYRVIQQGVASWYGPRFHGRLTANGERFNKFAMTAAHRQLPFGTVVRVTNLANGRSVTVRINDRGPYAGRRVIDLSYAAAVELGMHTSGVVQVKLEVAR